MKYYFYDLGAFNGLESVYMRRIFKELGIVDYEIHAFEPCYESYMVINDVFKKCNDKRMQLHRVAISDKNEKIKLYHSFVGNEVGHSIFSSKNNVNVNNFEEVDGVKFTSWLSENIVDFHSSFNVLKFNIEGAEYFLLKELHEENVIQHFNVICGDPYDILKIGDLKGNIQEHEENIKKVLVQTKMEIFPFSAQSNDISEIDEMIRNMKEALKINAAQ